MGKTHEHNDLHSRRTLRSLLAFTLAASLAAFGCTTNLNPGNGTPMRVGPELRSAPTSGISTGSETPVPPPPPPPMTSSYTRSEAAPNVAVKQRQSIRRSAAEAAAIMAGHQATRGRYLGPANPGPAGRAYASDFVNTGVVDPSAVTNPQFVVNSSGVVTTTGTTAAATIAGTNVTPGAAASTLPPGTFASVSQTATETISNNATVTAASAGTGVRVVRGTDTVTITNASSGSGQ